MKDIKKIIIFISIAVICICGYVITSYYLTQEKQIKELEECLNSSENKIVYIGKKSCYYCNMFNPVINYYKEKKDLDYLYIDLDKTSKKTTLRILDKLGIENVSEFGTPYFAIVKDNKVLYSNHSMNEYNLGEVLKQYNFISSSDLVFNYVDYDGYKDLINKDKEELIMLGHINFEDSLIRFDLFDYVKENNLKINYFDLSFKDKDEVTEFYKTYSILNDGDFELPIIMLIKGNQLIDYVNKDLNKDKFIELLTKNDIIRMGDIDG